MNDLRIFEKLCPSYQLATINFVNAYNNATDFQSRQNMFIEYSSKFTTLPMTWINWITRIKKLALNDAGLVIRDLISIKALSHFYNNEILSEFINRQENFLLEYRVWTKIVQCSKPNLSWPKKMNDKLFLLQAVQKKLILPNTRLRLFYEFYDEFSNSPISKELKESYENAEVLKHKICRHYLSNEKWLNLLKETNDEKFIIQNIEKKLSTKYYDKNLWVLYLGFVEEMQLFTLKLSIYSRYCRLFIVDEEMRNNYQLEIERFKEMKIYVFKFEVDLIKIHRDFVSKESAVVLMKNLFNGNVEWSQLSDDQLFKQLDNIPEEIPSFPDFAIEPEERYIRKSKPLQFQLEFSQKIDLPESLLYYILKNANYKLVQKFYASSKTIYSLFQKPICHRLEISDIDSTVSFQQSLYISKTTLAKALDFNGAKNLYLTNSLDIFSDSDNTVLSKLLPKIFKCEVRYLKIDGQKLTLNEFEFLSSNVENFKMSNSMVGDEESVSIKDLIERMPKVTKIKLSTISNKFFLSNTVFSKKITGIQELFFEHITEMIDPDLLFRFILENNTRNSQFILNFDQKIDENYKLILKNDVQARLDSINRYMGKIHII